DIMQKRSEPDYSRHLEQARTVGHDIREWLDTPVKQHELVRRLPEMGRIIPGPFRHVPVCGIFQILTVAVFLFALDVIGVVCSL
ncbi:hypothetical protein ACSLNR_28085, partial [Escherichia coli]